ncbi:cytochrome C [Novimethylophilus kurashikiensis]|uniref:Cytochrome C n=1 Tax=Novimethylophilus kurashikiensis TaxID=1825523 RepID=A0A2R5FB59_9PROT|nr:c-type cytochrome [Novimethylophilus kurashikiensis]GBG15466.1 cytochrome C [Novimethylophilus kurashikiensis]
MSDHHGKPPTTVGQFIIATLGGLFAPGLVIFMIVKMVMGIQNGHPQDQDAAAAEKTVVERIKPVGEVALKDASAGPAAAKSGEQVFNEVCIACHGTGALGSPKFGDSGAWGPRISQGYDTLVKHALAGIRAMPARGGNPDLSDIEVAGAVAYMANKAGANFKAPEAPKAEAAPAAAEPAKK